MRKGKTAPPKKIQKAQTSVKKPGSWPVWVLAGIVLLTAALYSNALHNEILIFDDNEYFQNYPEVLRLSWESIKKYFTGYYVIMYQPLPVLTFALNYHFTGMNTYPMHVVNLLLHLVNIVLVYYFIKSLVNDNAVALLAALFFGIHPMNVEAVTWISARSSSMYTLFYLAALICYCNYIKTGSRKNFFYVIVFFLLSLFSKAQAVTLPVVMLLLDYFYGRSFRDRKLYFEKIPFFILSIIFGLVTLGNTDTMRNLTQGMLIDYNATDIIFLFCYSFVFYLFKLFLPLNLCAVYVFPPKTDGLLPWEYYAAAPVFIFLLILLYRFRKQKMLMLGAGLFLITIAINIQIIPSRLFIVTERYAYFPYIGFYLFAFWKLSSYREKFPFRFEKTLPVIAGVIAVFILFFSYMTFQRNYVWKSDVPFLTDIIEKNPPVGYIYRAYGNRGYAYKRSGMNNEALQDFGEALRLDSTDARTFLNRGLVYMNMNQFNDALNDFTRGIDHDQKQPMLYNYRGQVRLMLKDTVGSSEDLRQCLKLDSTFSDAYNSLASIEYGRNNFEGSLNMLTKAINLDPKFSIAVKNRGLVFLQLKRNSDACNDFRNASYMNNDEAKNLYNQFCK